MTTSDRAAADPDDTHAWLEAVDGEAALEWVRARNADTGRWASGPAFARRAARLLEVLDSREKIPYVRKRGELYYNLWRDAANPRGLWRRTTFASYAAGDTAWETVLDIDALGRAERQSWVFAQATYLEPDCQVCMLALSPGGADARVQREFDVTTKAFVPAGFELPEAKSDVAWLDRDTLLVASDFGPGTLTHSGYPRTVRRWRRGTPLAAAEVVFEGAASDVAVGAGRDATRGYQRTFFSRSPTFFTAETFWVDGDGRARRIDIPDDARHWVHRAWLLVRLRTPWTPVAGGPTFAAGALLVTAFDALMDGGRDFVSLFTPTAASSLESICCTRDHVVVGILEDVKHRLEVWSPPAGGRAWRRAPMDDTPALGSVAVSAVDPETNEVFVDTQDYLTPASLHHGPVVGRRRLLRRMPAFFDAAPLAVSQHFATSLDGTRVPYFQVGGRDLRHDGGARTLLYGYGGFEVSLLPHYSGIIGRAWLEGGGVYIVANIRGGGEYGPAWHEAALKARRPRAYEDFAAVAGDLVDRGVSQAARLGIMGGSNGGLLVGNMLTTYPQLFGAAVCQVPLLDMKRYPHLLAGASWVGEYGDPDDPKAWPEIRAISPYHNVRADRVYPPTLFLTSTRDDRVHPGHARKMMARMMAMGHPVHYHENIEGGHGGAADNAQAAHMMALAYTFLDQHLEA